MLIESRIANISASGLAAVLLLGSKTEYYWKHTDGFTGLLVFAFLCCVAVALLSLFLIALVGIVRDRRAFKQSSLLAPLVCLVGIVTTLFDPIGINAEALQSKPVYVACYEGTMNGATLTFRANGHLEYYSVAAFGYSRFREGTWVQRGDTLETVFPDSAWVYWGHCLVIDHDRSILRALNLGTSKDHFTGFELGPCRGRN
jgi:hypothetical protein